jgi:colanic acid biosynthesis glycosyl transferase WcaI
MNQPHIIFLKQTTSSRHFFWELGQDVVKHLDTVTMYTNVKPDGQNPALKVITGPSYRKDTELHRLWSWFQYFVGAIRVIWSIPPSALLFIVAQPPYLPLLGYLRNRWLGQKYVVWVDDIYPDGLVRYGRLADEHLLTRVWRWLNRIILSRAERVFTLGPCMAQVLGQYVAGGTEQITVIPTWADTESIRPLPKESNPFALQYGQVGKLTVQYSGNLGLTHELDTMIQAAEKLQDYTDIHFMIIGFGPAWEKVVQSASQLRNMTALPLQPVDVLPYSLSTADVSVVTLRKGIEGVSMPSKTYHAMAAGAALLGVSHSPSDLESVIERCRCGINVEPGDVDGFVQAVVKFRETEYLAECRKNSRHAAETEFSRTVNVQRVLDAISPLLTIQ